MTEDFQNRVFGFCLFFCPYVYVNIGMMKTLSEPWSSATFLVSGPVVFRGHNFHNVSTLHVSYGLASWQLGNLNGSGSETLLLQEEWSPETDPRGCIGHWGPLLAGFILLTVGYVGGLAFIMFVTPESCKFRDRRLLWTLFIIMNLLGTLISGITYGAWQSGCSGQFAEAVMIDIMTPLESLVFEQGFLQWGIAVHSVIWLIPFIIMVVSRCRGSASEEAPINTTNTDEAPGYRAIGIGAKD